MKTAFNLQHTKLILVIFCGILLLPACQNQTSPSKQLSTPEKSPKTNTPAPLTLQTSLPPDKNYFIDNQLWGTAQSKGDKDNLLRAIDHSLSYLKTPAATSAYLNRREDPRQNVTPFGGGMKGERGKRKGRSMSEQFYV